MRKHPVLGRFLGGLPCRITRSTLLLNWEG
jgi:hypothetical protein